MKIQAQIEALETLAELDAEIKVLDEALMQEREALGTKKGQLAGLELEGLSRGKKGYFRHRLIKVYQFILFAAAPCAATA